MASAAWGQVIVSIVSTGFLLVTLGLSIGATRAAIEQATTARREFEELERPYLFLEIIEPATAPSNGETAPIEYFLENHGRSPALVLRIQQERQRVWWSQSLPTPIDPATDKGIDVPHGVVVPAGGKSQTFKLTKFPNTAAPQKEPGDHELWYFLGYVTYQDTSGTFQYVKGFCCYHAGDGKWLLSSSDMTPDPYNYDHKIQRAQPPPKLGQRLLSAWAALTK